MWEQQEVGGAQRHEWMRRRRRRQILQTAGGKRTGNRNSRGRGACATNDAQRAKSMTGGVWVMRRP